MITRFEQTKHSQIMVEPVPKDDVDKFGVVDLGDVELNQGESSPIKSMVEKPPVDEAPSNLAVVGRYVLSKNIWPLLAKTPQGAGDEIQLTDAIAMLMQDEKVDAYAMKGRSHDCGSKIGYLKATIEFALRRDEFAGELKTFIKTLI